MEFPTQAQVVARIKERQPKDMFGFEWREYICALDFEHAKEFLKPEATAEGWEQTIKGRDDAIRAMRDYMEFAFEKANNCRGLSANRSVMHYIAWTWLAGDADLSSELQTSEYRYYGKPQLVMVAEKYGFDWKAHDNGQWTNSEDSDGITADKALAA